MPPQNRDFFLIGSAQADPTVRGALRGKITPNNAPRGAEGPAILRRSIPPVYVPVFWEHLPQIPEQHA